MGRSFFSNVDEQNKQDTPTTTSTVEAVFVRVTNGRATSFGSFDPPRWHEHPQPGYTLTFERAAALRSAKLTPREGPMAKSERLSSIEAAYYYLDGPNVAHEGLAYAILEGELDYKAYSKRFERILAVAPRYRQRPVTAPFHVALPAWEYDPNFDLRYHIQHVRLDPPGTDEQLHEWVESIQNSRLDLQRPPWRTYVVHGLTGGRTALVTKMHHMMTDAVGLLTVQRQLYDTSPVTLQTESIGVEPPPVEPMPGTLSRLATALAEHARSIARCVAAAPSTILNLKRTMAGPRFRTGLALIKDYLQSPTVRLPFNSAHSGRTSLAVTEFSLDDIAAVREGAGGTVNDVLLSAVGGALDRYVQRLGIDTKGRSMRIAFSANLRVPGHDGNLENFSAAATLPLPFGIDDPVERLQYIRDWTAKAKECRMAWGIWMIISVWRALLTPPGLAALYSLMSRPTMQRLYHALMRKPPMHMYFSNVRGPDSPLYVLGHRIQSRTIAPIPVPIAGLSCGAINYDGRIRLNFCGDCVSVPNLDLLVQFTEEAFAQLYEAALARTPAVTAPHVPRGIPASRG